MAFNKKTDNIPMLKEDIKLKILKPLYLFWGDEDFLKNYYIEEMCKSAGKKNSEFDYLVFDGQALDVDDFYNFVTAVSFSRGRKVALLRNIDVLKLKATQRDTLIEGISQIPEGVTVIAYYDSMFFDSLEKEQINKYISFFMKNENSCEVEFTIRGSLELCRWIEKHFDSADIKVDRAFCEYLLEQTDGTMTSINKEIEKLCSYYSGKKLTKEDIDKVCGKRFETNIFEITNALVARSFEVVLTKLSDIKKDKEEPYRVLAAIINTLSELLFVKAAVSQGITSSAIIAKDLGFSPKRAFLINRYIAAASSCEIAFITKCVEICSDADIELKRSRADGWIILEQQIAKMLVLSKTN